MTASWGGLGVLWGKPVATAYIPTAFIELKEETNANTANETTI